MANLGSQSYDRPYDLRFGSRKALVWKPLPPNTTFMDPTYLQHLENINVNYSSPDTDPATIGYKINDVIKNPKDLNAQSLFTNPMLEEKQITDILAAPAHAKLSPLEFDCIFHNIEFHTWGSNIYLTRDNVVLLRHKNCSREVLKIVKRYIENYENSHIDVCYVFSKAELEQVLSWVVCNLNNTPFSKVLIIDETKEIKNEKDIGNSITNLDLNL